MRKLLPAMFAVVFGVIAAATLAQQLKQNVEILKESSIRAD